MFLLHRCQPLCLLKNASSHIKPWPTLPELAGRFYSGPGSIFWSPHNQLAKTLLTHADPLSGLMARSLVGTPSKTSPSLKAFSSPECASICCTHICILAGKRVPLGFPLRMHLKHWLQAGPKWPVDRGICGQHMCSFHLAWNPIQHLWVWGKEGGWRAEECLHFFPSLSPSIAGAVSALGRLPSPMWGQTALISLCLGCNSTLLYAKYPPGCPTFSGSSPVSELL